MKELKVDKNNSGKKLFRYVQDVLPGLTNTEIFRLLRKEIIKVNGAKENANYMIKEGDKIIFFLADDHFDKKGRKLILDKNRDKFHSVKTNLDVIFEDRDLLVVNKIAGLLVHPDKKEFKNVLSEMVKAYLYKKGEYRSNNIFTPSPCHRIDSNTSGLIVFAKNHISLKNTTRKFRERNTIKKYLALVFGKLTNKIFLSSYIDSSENRENKVAIEDFQKLNMVPDKNDFLEKNDDLSATIILPLQSAGNSTLSEVEIWTGKKHQIRVHLKECGNPLLGDNKYFTPASMSLSQMFNIKNYLLHSHKLQLDGYPEWVAPVPENFKKTVFEIMKIEI